MPIFDYDYDYDYEDHLAGKREMRPGIEHLPLLPEIIRVTRTSGPR